MAMLANSLIVWSEVWKRKDNPKDTALGGAGNAVTMDAVSTQRGRAAEASTTGECAVRAREGSQGLASEFRELCG
jgi:hypothetical protein